MIKMLWFPLGSDNIEDRVKKFLEHRGCTVERGTNYTRDYPGVPDFYVTKHYSCPTTKVTKEKHFYVECKSKYDGLNMDQIVWIFSNSKKFDIYLAIETDCKKHIIEMVSVDSNLDLTPVALTLLEKEKQRLITKAESKLNSINKAINKAQESLIELQQEKQRCEEISHHAYLEMHTIQKQKQKVTMELYELSLPITTAEKMLKKAEEWAEIK